MSLKPYEVKFGDIPVKLNKYISSYTDPVFSIVPLLYVGSWVVNKNPTTLYSASLYICRDNIDNYPDIVIEPLPHAGKFHIDPYNPEMFLIGETLIKCFNIKNQKEPINFKEEIKPYIRWIKSNALYFKRTIDESTAQPIIKEISREDYESYLLLIK